jgi:hypothetical protein
VEAAQVASVILLLNQLPLVPLIQLRLAEAEVAPQAEEHREVELTLPLVLYEVQLAVAAADAVWVMTH